MGTAKNDITGDLIKTKLNTPELEENWDLIFPERKSRLAAKKRENDEYWAKIKAETEKRLSDNSNIV